MSDNPNQLSQFWQELKRRKVVRVITVYAAAAFVILELVDIITEPLKLPQWLLPVVIVLLCIGFIIAVILSWIYDIHPEGGIVMTESAHHDKSEDNLASSKGWKIASYVSFAVIVALIVLNLIPRSNKLKEITILETSIAVLPFENMSIDEEDSHLGRAFTDEIIMELQKIKAFDRVLSYSSTMQYAENRPTIPEIAEKLNVNYLVEGSIQRHEEDIRVRVQVIRAINEDHVWGDDYDGNRKDIFSIQDEIAFKVAKELKMTLSPEEKLIIERTPTKNMDAYDYYLLGQHYLTNSYQDDDLLRAIDYQQLALDLDSTFAQAYLGLATIYISLNNKAILSPNEVYTKAKAYVLKALELNEELSYAHSLLGNIKLNFEYDFEGAERESIRALEINPNNYAAHLFYAEYLSLMGRHTDAISHADLAYTLDPLPSTKFSKSYILFYAGYRSEALKLAEEARDSYPDNPYCYWRCAVFYTKLGMYDQAISMLETQINIMGNDNISDEIGLLGYIYGQLGQIEKSYKQLERLDELSSKGFYVSPRARIRLYLGLSNLDKAIELLEKAIEDRSITPRSIMNYTDKNLQNDPRFIEIQKKAGLRK